MSTNIVPFPMTGVARLRGELVICHSERMVERWCDRLERAARKGEITRAEYISLLNRSVEFPAQARRA